AAWLAVLANIPATPPRHRVRRQRAGMERPFPLVGHEDGTGRRGGGGLEPEPGAPPDGHGGCGPRRGQEGGDPGLFPDRPGVLIELGGAIGAPPKPPSLRASESRSARAYDSLKLTVTVITTGTGTPLSSVGVYTQLFTALTAESSRSGLPRSTFTSVTRPSGLMTASRTTTPSTLACLATSGYAGG